MDTKGKRKNLTVEEVRDTCLACTMKHVVRARGFCMEFSSYPEHFFYGLGEMSHAEDECRRRHPRLANLIRDHRLRWEKDAKQYPEWKFLVQMVLDKMLQEGSEPEHLSPDDHV